MIHRLTIRSRRDRHRPAARLLGVIGGSARDTMKINRDRYSPWGLTAGKISSDGFECSSVANRSIKINQVESRIKLI